MVFASTVRRWQLRLKLHWPLALRILTSPFDRPWPTAAGIVAVVASVASDHGGRIHPSRLRWSRRLWLLPRFNGAMAWAMSATAWAMPAYAWAMAATSTDMPYYGVLGPLWLSRLGYGNGFTARARRTTLRARGTGSRLGY